MRGNLTGRWPEIACKTAYGVTIVSGLFSLIVSILLIASTIQLKSVAPLDSPALSRLATSLAESPTGPESQILRDELRALDLLARKAFFTARRQIRTGGYLLLAGSLLFVICLKSLTLLRRQPSDPGTAVDFHDPQLLRAPVRRRLLAGGATLFILGLAASFFSNDILANETPFGGFEPPPNAAAPADSETGQQADRSAGESAKPISEISDATLTDTPGATLTDTLAECQTSWPAFRGHGGNGISASLSAPLTWDAESGEGVLWKTEVPLPGFSSPIVWGKRVFLSGADSRVQMVFCYSADTGDLLWQREIKEIPGSPAKAPRVTSDTGYAASTMTTDGRGVYAVFATGDAVAFSMEGKTLWSRNLGVPDNHYGHSSPLIVYRDRVIVQYDHASSAALMALEPGSGRTVWRTVRDVETSWASPVVVDTGRRTEIVLNANPIVAAYDPENGRLLWEVDCMIGEVAPSPAYAGGMLFAVNQNALLVAIDVGRGSILWEAYDDLPDVASPLAVGRYVIIAASYGVISCFDSREGALLWQQEFEEGFYASPVLVGDYVYLMDRTGVMRIFEAADAYKAVGEGRLGESSLCTPAFAAGRIYIRGDKHLFCIGGSDEVR